MITESSPFFAIRIFFLCFHFLSLIWANSDSTKCNGGRRLLFPEKTNQTLGFIKFEQSQKQYCEWLISNSKIPQLKFINLKINFSEFSTCDVRKSDVFYIFDGDSYEHPLIATINGQINSMSTLVSSSGFLLILHYFKNISNVNLKFSIQYSLTECPDNCSSHGTCHQNECRCNKFWTGNRCHIELCPNDCSQSGQCVQNFNDQTSCLKVKSFDHFCDCHSDIVGQSCNFFLKPIYSTHQRQDFFNWTLLFSNDNLFSSRVSHASVFDPQTDAIFTYGGRNYQTIFSDFLKYKVSANKWHNLTDKTCGTHSDSNPGALWGHSLNVLQDFLILFGGIRDNGTISNQLWIYEITKKYWTQKIVQNSILMPGLAFHTAVIVDSRWLYIHGGQFQNQTYSSQILRIDCLSDFEKWHIVVPVNANDFLQYSRAAHSAVFYPRLRSIIIFGGLTNQKNEINSGVIYFNVDKNLWISSIKSSQIGSQLEPFNRAFHSMLLINDFLIVFGGLANSKLQLNSKQCFSNNKIHVYCLTCHRWIDLESLVSSITSFDFTLNFARFPMENLHSHALIRRKNQLFLLGGSSSGSVRNEIWATTFPQIISFFNSSSKLCSRIKEKQACERNGFCYWCPKSKNHKVFDSQCLHRGSFCSTFADFIDNHQCPGFCSLFDSCSECLEYSQVPFLSFREKNYSNYSNFCSWDTAQMKCVANQSNIQLKPRLITKVSDCQNIRSGITVLKYNHPFNLSFPDEFSISPNSDIRIIFEKSFMNLSDESSFRPTTEFNLVRILGYIHPLGEQSYDKTNAIRLYLSSTSSNVSFNSNTPNSNFSLNKVPSSFEKFHSLYVDLSKNSYHRHFLIDFIAKFPIKTYMDDMDYERIQISWKPLNSNDSYKLLGLKDLSQFNESDQCSKHISCIACLSNRACAWCSEINQCVAFNSESGYCKATVTRKNQCFKCSHIQNCQNCVDQKHCEWLWFESICVLRGRYRSNSNSSMIHHKELCPLECHQRTSCESCLDLSHHCVWCHSIDNCRSSSFHHSTSLSDFDFCESFQEFSLEKNNFLRSLNLSQKIQCNNCLRYVTCSSCQSDSSCIWYWLKLENSKGFCLKRSSKIENVNKFFLKENSDLRCLKNETCLISSNTKCNDCADDEFSTNCVKVQPPCNKTCIHGVCSEVHCACDLGWTGDQCDIDCQCNFHSTCHNGIGHCDRCEHNTQGQNCQRCANESFGNASAHGCQVCQCNGHGDYLKGLCNSQTGVCFCLNHTEGASCERCREGYYGDSRNGGICYLECRNRAAIFNSSSGSFGSYIRDLYYFDKNHNSRPLNIFCLWIISSYSSLEKSLLAIDKNQQQLNHHYNQIELIVYSNCSRGSLLIYDGIPYFVSATKTVKSTLIVNLCGTASQTNNEKVLSTSGVMTVIYFSDDMFQGFNFSYHFLLNSTFEALTSKQNSISHTELGFFTSFSTIDRKFLKNSTSSIWPINRHSMFYFDYHLLMIGGQLESKNLNLILFSLKNNTWHLINQQPNVKTPSNRQFFASCIIDRKIYLFGGLDFKSNKVLNDFWYAQIDKNSTSQIQFVWHSANSKRKIPSLMGHSLNVIQFQNQKCILLIGGYSPIDGFLHQQYLYFPESGQWDIFSTRGAAPIGIVAHSSVYHEPTDSLYLFGGIDFKDSQKLVMSNTLYLLNLKTKIWRRIQATNSAINAKHIILPRYSHWSVTLSNYMLILGGKTYYDIKTLSSSFSVYAYFYQCNKWIFLSNESVWESMVQPSSSQTLSFAFDHDSLYFYEYQKMPIDSVSIQVIQIPSDFCNYFSNNRDNCLAMEGCSFCMLIENNKTSFQKLCFDKNLANNLIHCSEETILENSFTCLSDENTCDRLTTCTDCITHNYETEKNAECQWCVDCNFSNGRCISMNETCETTEFINGNFFGKDIVTCSNSSIVLFENCPGQKCLATDCDKCVSLNGKKLNEIDDQQKSSTCIWTRQIYKYVRLGHKIDSFSPMLDWACIESSILRSSQPLNITSQNSMLSLTCPVRCYQHQTCSACLEEANGDESGSHECIWYEVTNECLSPTFALLKCEQGFCDEGFVYRRTLSQCPKKCSTHKKASDCLASLHCGWCSINSFDGIDGIGLCIKGGLFGPFGSQKYCLNHSQNFLNYFNNQSSYKLSKTSKTEWHYLHPPKENECLNQHHSCDLVSQLCVDLDEGFMCRCKRGYRMLENVCKPICNQGCIYGVCVSPDVCRCNFGYVGEDCSFQCQCYGHSTCPSPKRLNECLECHNNTQGSSCQQCKPFFVGNPENYGSFCFSCHHYCHNHSNLCFSEEHLFKKNVSSELVSFNDDEWLFFGSKLKHGPTDKAICMNCKNNTEGERCDRCKLGFFKISNDIRDGCRKCVCNGHGFLCNPFNGESCNCHNNTENDRQCNYLSSKEYSNYINKTYFFKSSLVMATYSFPCWMLQCSKCKDYFYGVPTNDHQCYRHMYMEKEYCFDPISPEDCLSNHTRPLLTGRTVLFGVQPRYMNVDIKVILYSVEGNVDLYLSPKDDMFVVKVDQTNGYHYIFIDNKYIQPNYNSSLWNIQQKTNFSAFINNHLNNYYPQDLDSLDHSNIMIPLKSSYNLHIENVENQLSVHYMVEKWNEILIIRNIQSRAEITIPHRLHDLRTMRFFLIVKGSHNWFKSNFHYGNLMFRQDQCRIDLFVFFCVFFACFFLFLCFSVIVWKIKHTLNLRRMRHQQEIELAHMARRPVSRIIVLFDDNEKIFFNKTKFQPQNSPLKERKYKPGSVLRHLGFNKDSQIHPENKNEYSSTTFFVGNGRKKLTPVSVEQTSDGLAAVMTILIEFPGDYRLTPSFNRISAASSLVSLKQSPQILKMLN